MDDEVLIRVGNPISGSTTGGEKVAGASAPAGRAAVVELAGWTGVRIQRSCEHFPSVFEITATERFPGRNLDAPVVPGDPVQVLFTRGYGRDVVVTGYVDRVVPRLSAGQHELVIIGRSKCGDLVDCSQVWPTGQFNNMKVADIARALCKGFGDPWGGIAVTQTSGDETKVIAKLVAQYTETPYELIERIARVAALLVYDDENGDLVLSRVGTDRMSTGAAEGKNVQSAEVVHSMDQRYSEYRVRRLTFDTLPDTGVAPEADIVAVLPDPGVPRFRPRTVIAETQQGMRLDSAQARGEWEASRRFGRSTAIRVTVDSWRDGDGNLWAPNRQIDLDLPTLKIGPPSPGMPWVIGTVTFRRDERGTFADLVVMPAAAFEVLPLPLTPLINAGPY